MDMATAPFGTWDSPIDAAMVATNSIAFQDIVLDNKNIYWSEMRPSEGGRYVIVKKGPNSKPIDVLPEKFNARTRVHEYGGSAFTVKDDIIYFVNYKDQKIYQIKPNKAPKQITQQDTRFADMHVTPYGLIAVAEKHDDANKPMNFIANINVETGEINPLSEGYDFYAGIAISPNYKKIAWISWNQPNMPWDNNELWTGDLTDNGIINLQQIDPDYKDQAFFQPLWQNDEQLLVVSDKSNWWNLYSVHNQQLEKTFEIDSEIGLPQWVFNMATWGFQNDQIVSTFSEDGKGKLWRYDNNQLKGIDLPYSSFSLLRYNDNNLVVLASAPNKPTDLISIFSDNQYEVLKSSRKLSISQNDLSTPEHISFESANNRKAFAFFYPPKNSKFQGLPNTLPPLIVMSHGGPTASASPSLNLKIQYWTSRGFAVADVNYAGSTGYGRKYRKSLENNWGIYDIEDCIAVTQHLSKENKIDPNKLAITGGSAGGYTTLAALTFSDTFHVGASHYGVSDLEALAKETHKFEAKYLDLLIGPYPEQTQTYLDRSPIHHIDKLSNPIIFFQGEEDKIVPPAQAESMYQALKQKGIKTSYFLFPEEQHGFRKSENIITALEEQRKFFTEVLELA